MYLSFSIWFKSFGNNLTTFKYLCTLWSQWCWTKLFIYFQLHGFKCSNVHGLVLLKWILSNVSSTESICVEMMLCLEHWNFPVIYRCNRLWCTLYSNLKIIWLCIANMIMLQRLLIISLEVFCCAGWEFLALTSWLQVILGNFLSGCVCVCVCVAFGTFNISWPLWIGKIMSCDAKNGLTTFFWAVLVVCGFMVWNCFDWWFFCGIVI